jgi:quinoprotein glucose dehydrogenase
MNTGEHLWFVPVGETPAAVLNHPALKDKQIPNTGSGSIAKMVVTKSLLIYSDVDSEGTPYLFALDKATGRQVGKVEIPEKTNYGMMTYMHEGKQYLVLQTGPTLTTMVLAQ